MFYLFWGCYTLHTYNYDTSTCYSNIFSLQIATVKFATILECLPPSFTRPQKLKQFSIDSSIMDVWNTTKSPTQQKSGYLVSSTAFWIAESLVMFFGNQEVYHAVLGNMIKTILKPCTKITVSSCFFLPQKSWGWDSSKQPVPASGSHHLFSCMQLYAKALACDEAAACVKLLVGWPADVVPMVIFPNGRIQPQVLGGLEWTWMNFLWAMSYGYESKPCTPGEPQNSWDLWMFIPLKMVLIGIDP